MNYGSVEFIYLVVFWLIFVGLTFGLIKLLLANFFIGLTSNLMKLKLNTAHHSSIAGWIT